MLTLTSRTDKIMPSKWLVVGNEEIGFQFICLLLPWTTEHKNQYRESAFLPQTVALEEQISQGQILPHRSRYIKIVSSAHLYSQG